MPSEVPSGWSVRPLGEVATVLLSNVDKKSVAGEPPVRLCNYMDVYTNSTITDHLDFMRATATKEQIAKFGLRKGDVMITKDSEDPTDIGIPSVVVEEFTGPVLCGYHLALLRPVTVDGPYLAWALRSRPVNEQFVRRANGSTRFGLTSGVIDSAKVPVPPLPEQKKIAAILSSVDEAIQATQAVIDQTRRVKEGLLQDLLTRGLPGHTRFKQTEIGEIPESWEVLPLGLVLESLDHLRVPVKSTDRAETKGVIPYYGASGIIDWVNEFLFNETLLLVGEDGANLLTRTSPIAFVISGPAWVNNHAHVYRSKGGVRLDFAAHWIESQSLEPWVTGSAQPKLNGKAAARIPVPVPPLEEQQGICNVLSGLDGSIGREVEKREALDALKAGLLQDLLTGKVRVSP